MQDDLNIPGSAYRRFPFSSTRKRTSLTFSKCLDRCTATRLDNPLLFIIPCFMSLSRYETPRYPRKRRFRENIFHGKSLRTLSLGLANTWRVTSLALKRDWFYWEIYRMIANEETIARRKYEITRVNLPV